MEKQPNSRMCFVCGIDNPIGLHLSFCPDDAGRCIARFRPRPDHQGFPGQLHGGIANALLFIAMGLVSVVMTNSFFPVAEHHLHVRGAGARSEWAKQYLSVASPWLTCRQFPPTIGPCGNRESQSAGAGSCRALARPR